MRYTLLPGPLGDLLATADETGALTGLYFPDHRRGPVTDPALDPAWTRDDAAFSALREQLAAYFAGRLRDFDLPLAAAGTPFQQKVWDGLRALPYASTTSYGALAEVSGVPGAARAVGAAVGRNPISIVVPCHRVVGATGAITGYAGGLPAKRHLLALESGATPLVSSRSRPPTRRATRGTRSASRPGPR